MIHDINFVTRALTEPLVVIEDNAPLLELTKTIVRFRINRDHEIIGMTSNGIRCLLSKNYQRSFFDPKPQNNEFWWVRIARADIDKNSMHYFIVYPVEKIS